MPEEKVSLYNYERRHLQTLADLLVFSRSGVRRQVKWSELGEITKNQLSSDCEVVELQDGNFIVLEILPEIRYSEHSADPFEVVFAGFVKC